jgi:hypothetical protein
MHRRVQNPLRVVQRHRFEVEFVAIRDGPAVTG